MFSIKDVQVRYQTLDIADIDLHICTLRDNQQYSDTDNEALELGICSASWPLFGTLWPSSLVLAHHMRPFDIAGKRILEVGCGIGLVSLLLNHRQADITATDYHPAVKAFLDTNTQLNNDPPIAFERLDWADNNGHLGRFDTIVGSDLLYEDQHIELLANFIERHAKPNCEVIIADPGRGRKNKLTSKMQAFGFSSEHTKPQDTHYLDRPFKGYILSFKRTSLSSIP